VAAATRVERRRRESRKIWIWPNGALRHDGEGQSRTADTAIFRCRERSRRASADLEK
jgi:hypothetical protein